MERWIEEVCDRIFARGVPPEVKGVHSNQNSKLEASNLHGLTRMGHNLLTGQGHHWGLEETLILLLLPRYQAAVKLLYCKRGSGLRNQACHWNSPKSGHRGALSEVILNTAGQRFSTPCLETQGPGSMGRGSSLGLWDFYKGKIGIFHFRQVFFFFTFSSSFFTPPPSL